MLLVSSQKQYNIGVCSSDKHLKHDFVLPSFLAGKIDGSGCSYGPIDLAIKLYICGHQID